MGRGFWQISGVLGALVIAGCSAPPDLENRVSPAAREAPFPKLVPTAPIVAAHGGPVTGAPGAEGLDARIARLESRADQLQRGSIVDPATLRRLEAARAAAAAQ